MDSKLWLLLLLLVAVVGAGYYYTNYMSPTAQYHNSTISADHNAVSSSDTSVYIPPRPSVVALLATKSGCIYCDKIEDELKSSVILKTYNMDIKLDRDKFLSKLNSMGLDYLGVPTVIIGTYAFYSYQDTNECPYINGKQSEAVTIKIGEETVTLCRLPDHSNYYIYMPSRVETLIGLCNKYKDPSCYS